MLVCLCSCNFNLMEVAHVYTICVQSCGVLLILGAYLREQTAVRVLCFSSSVGIYCRAEVSWCIDYILGRHVVVFFPGRRFDTACMSLVTMLSGFAIRERTDDLSLVRWDDDVVLFRE